MEQLSFENLPKAVNLLNQKLENIERLLLDKKAQQTTEQLEQLLTVQEAAQFLRLSVPTIYSKVNKGELPVMKRSKRLYFSSIELMEYLKKGRRKPISEITTEADNYLNQKQV